MHALGIIAEYNPFHNGHLYHLTKSKEKAKQNFVVVAMSGHFTQRGEAAILDKWTRAALALKGGADLILELPFAFAARSAQHFAEGGVRLLNALGVVGTLSFGSENADIALLEKIAALSSQEETISLLKHSMKNGSSYAAALSAAVRELGRFPAKTLQEPNNILAVEYLKALKKYKSAIRPLAIERKTAGHHDMQISAPIASAAAIRRQLLKEDGGNFCQALPPSSAAAVEQALKAKDGFPSAAALGTAALAALRRSDLKELQEILSINEGLEHKIIDAALSSTSIEELLFKIKSKRYPLSRLQRMIPHLLLRSPKALFHQFDAAGPLYARVLAFNGNGRLLLKEIKKRGDIPVITKTAGYLTTTNRAKQDLTLLQQMLAYDTYATDLYALCFRQPKQGALDFTRSPLYLG